MAEQPKKKAPQAKDYRRLPTPVKLEDTVAEHEVRPVPDPDGGINPDQAFMLRNAGG